MSSLAPEPQWPSDPDHREAIETLLLMAAAEHRWGESRRARRLLDGAAETLGGLPAPYARIRARCGDQTTPAIERT